MSQTKSIKSFLVDNSKDKNLKRKRISPIKLDEDDSEREKLKKVREELSADDKFSRLLDGVESQNKLLKQACANQFATKFNQLSIFQTLI